MAIEVVDGGWKNKPNEQGRNSSLKNRSVAIIKGKFENRHRFKINEVSIPTFSDKPIKTLTKSSIKVLEVAKQ